MTKFSKDLVWLYTWFQLVTKGVIGVLVVPIYSFAVRQLIYSTGRVSISSGDFISFLFSAHGLGMLALTFVMLVLVTAFDINSFIVMSSLIKEKKLKFSLRSMLSVSLKSAKTFLNVGGAALLAYVAVLVPLTGIGINLSITKDFKIPNFITSVIHENPVYLALYSAVLAALTFVSIKYIFTFHYVIIKNERIGKAMKKSAALLRGRWRRFLMDFFVKRTLALFVIAVAAVLLLFFGTAYVFETGMPLFAKRAVSIFLLLLATGTATYVLFMFVPFLFTRLTDFFYMYSEERGESPIFEAYRDTLSSENFTRIKFRTKAFIMFILAGAVILDAVYACIVAYNFEELFYTPRTIDIIAHRGGGDLSAENSLDGLQKAIEHGASWSEIDIQRTKDGHYIINHDKDFSRLAGVSKSSEDMTLAEIKQLSIKDHFDNSRQAQEFATLEEMLDAAKGRIGLYLELKGSTADSKMVDDVVKMVRARGMEREVVLLSLDYNLIRYIEDKYSDMASGYLYFFSIGDTKDMASDYLIMEEREATEDNVAEILAAGKKAVVWTVNTEESMKRFLYSKVDGIITDHVPLLKSEIDAMSQMTDFEIILGRFFGFES